MNLTSEITKLGSLPILKAKMNPDLHISNTLRIQEKGMYVFGKLDIQYKFDKISKKYFLSFSEIQIKVLSFIFSYSLLDIFFLKNKLYVYLFIAIYLLKRTDLCEITL